ncbi:MAG: hypothetical protein DRH50_14860 [Deltaproteobacteria bacterium]|nr:MAG: hypothetical protein DRH50_14860 [Deltaproteobacteria bacterium]
MLFILIQISPYSGNKRAGSVRQHQGEVQTSMAVRPVHKFQLSPLQGVPIANDGYFGGKALEVGSVS